MKEGGSKINNNNKNKKQQATHADFNSASRMKLAVQALLDLGRGPPRVHNTAVRLAEREKQTNES